MNVAGCQVRGIFLGQGPAVSRAGQTLMHKKMRRGLEPDLCSTRRALLSSHSILILFLHKTVSHWTFAFPFPPASPPEHSPCVRAYPLDTCNLARRYSDFLSNCISSHSQEGTLTRLYPSSSSSRRLISVEPFGDLHDRK